MSGLSPAIECFLGELELDHADQVRDELLRLLAEAVEESPPCARPRVASEVRSLLAELQAAAEPQESNVRTLLREAGAG
jgi:hypothetical protein